jgi:hypothetical protein
MLPPQFLDCRPDRSEERFVPGMVLVRRGGIRATNLPVHHHRGLDRGPAKVDSDR